MKKNYFSFSLIILLIFLCSENVYGQISDKQKPVNDATTIADTIRAKVLLVDLINTEIIRAKHVIADSINYSNITREKNKNVVRINFETKEISIPKKINYHQFYHVVIDSINMNLYNIEVNNRDSTITTSVKFPSFESVTLEGLSELLRKISPVAVPLPAPVNTDIKNRFQLAKPDTSIYIINTEIERQIGFIYSFEKRLTALAQEIDSLSLMVQKLALSYLANDKELNQLLKNEFSYSQILKDSEDYRTRVRNISREITQKSELYNQFSSDKDNNNLINALDTLKKNDKAIKELFAKVSANANKVFNSVNSETVGKWLSTIIHLENNKERTYRSQPFQLTGDYSELTVKIIPKSKDFGLSTFENKYLLPKPPRFNIGGGAAFYYSWYMRDDAFSIRSTPIDSVTTEYNVVDEEQPDGEIGIASVIQFGWAWDENRRWNTGISIGPGASISSTIKPRLLTTGFISYGRKQKVSLNFGFLMGQVNRLSTAFETSETLNEKPDNILVSKFRMKGAISIGYIFDI